MNKRAANIRSALSLRRGNTKGKSFMKSPWVNNLKRNLKNMDLKFNISVVGKEQLFRIFVWCFNRRGTVTVIGRSITTIVNEPNSRAVILNLTYFVLNKKKNCSLNLEKKTS